MQKTTRWGKAAFALAFLVYPLSAEASYTPVTVEESDGSPSVKEIATLKVSNGTLTDNGNGVVTITNAGGSGTVNTGATGYFAYYPGPGQTVDDQTVLYTDGTNVGIGTSSPIKKLQVNVTAGTNNGMTVTTGIPGSVADESILLYPDTDQSRALISIRNDNGGEISAFTNDDSASVPLILQRVGGNVGIGTTAPTAALQLFDDNRVLDTWGNFAITTSDPQGVDLGGQVVFGGFNDTAASNLSGFASVAGRKENAISGDYLGYLQFATGNATNNLIERMRINSAGNVGIGTTAPNNADLHVFTEHTPASGTFDQHGIKAELQLNGSQTSGNIYGISSNAQANGTYGTQVVTNAYGVHSQVNENSGNITNAFGYFVQMDDGGGTSLFTNAYGLYIGSLGNTASNKWGVYDTSAKSYFAGNVGIASTAPNEKLDVNGAVKLAQVTAPGVTTDKLYNVGGTLTWNGSALLTGASSTLQGAYGNDTDTGDTIIALTTADDSLIFRNPAASGTDSAYLTLFDQLNTGAKDAVMINQAGTGYALRVNDDGTSTDSTPVVITAAGNVGIGTTAASVPLVAMVGSADTTVASFINGGGWSEITVGNGTNDTYIGADSTHGYIKSAQNIPFSIGTNNTDKLTILGNGNVGIGTTAPGALAHVWNTSAAGNAVIEGLRLSHIDSDSAGANGLGTSISFTGESDSAGVHPEMARIEAVMTDVANASKDADLYFYTLGSNAGAGSNTATYKMGIQSDGDIDINAAAKFGSDMTNAYMQFQTSGNNLVLTLDGNTTMGLSNSSGPGMNMNLTGRNVTSTSDSPITLSIGPTVAPTSGTATYAAIGVSPTINQTGGANGVTRGLYINPTLTAAADFRAIETVAGNVIFGSTSGNVGIGTTNASSKLRVVGDGSFTGNLGVSGTMSVVTTVGDAANIIASGGAGSSTARKAVIGNVTAFFDATSGNLTNYGGHFNANSTNVGGNTLTNVGLYATSSGGDVNYAAIFDQGNVGIGSATPAEKLDVNGAVKLAQVTAPGVTTDKLYNVGGTLTWNGSALLTGASSTLQGAYGNDTDTGDTIIALTAADDSLIFRNPASAGSDSTNVLTLEQLATGAVDNTIITHAGTGYALRVNDDGTSTDSTPFVIAADGNVGVGMVPGYKLDLSGALRASGQVIAAATGSETSPSLAIAFTNNGIFYGGSNSLAFTTGGAEKVRILQSGNVGIGTTAPGALLNVGSGTPTTAANGIRFGTDASANLYRSAAGIVKTDGALNINGSTYDVAGITGIYTLNIKGSQQGSAAPEVTVNSNSTQDYTSGNGSVLDVGDASNFSPTSGTGTWDMLKLAGTINQTGGANGITRGLYVNPTLTAAADFRAIEVVTGKSVFGDNIGVGTTGPESKLDVRWSDNSQAPVVAFYNTNTAGANALSQMEMVSGTGNRGVALGIAGPSAGTAGQAIEPSSAYLYGLGGSANLNIVSNLDMNFYTGGNLTGETMTLTTSNVGIGSATPAEKLDVNGAVKLAQVTAPGVTTDKLYNVGGTLTWNGSALLTGASSTLQGAYGNDTDTGDTIIALTTADDSLIFRNPAASGTDSAYLALFDQLNTGAKDGVMINQAGTGYALRVNDDGTSTDSTPFVIDDTGLVGIGSVTPAFFLDMVGTSASGQMIRMSSSNTTGTTMHWINTDTGGRQYSIVSTGTANSVGVGKFSFRDGTASATRMVIDSNGNLGVGSTSPTAVLDVVNPTSMTPAAAANARIAKIGGAITEAGSGNHILLAGLEIVPPTITGAAGTVSDTASLYLNDAPSATVSGRNYAFWVDNGLSRFDGNVGIGTQSADNGRLYVLQSATGVTTNGLETLSAYNMGATFNTTAGALTNYTGAFVNTSTRSAGSNNLVNVGLYAMAAGGQLNHAAIFDGGNVGIGSNTPAEKLDVNGAVKLAQVTAPGVTTDKLYNVGGTLTWNGTNISGGASKWTDGGATTYLTATGDNVGIGTTSASELLKIGGDSLSDTTRQAMVIGHAGVATPSAVGSSSDGDKIVLWNIGGDIKTAIGVESSGLWFQQGGNNTAHMSFYTSPTTTAPVERLRIAADGNIGIGTSAPAYALDVAPTGGTAATTAFFQDRTATTGSTKVVVKAGAVNGSGNPVFEIQNAAGSGTIQMRADTGAIYTNIIAPIASQPVYFEDSYAGSATGDQIQITNNGYRAFTSGVGSALATNTVFDPTSGTGAYSAINVRETINQTGGANGVTRGLHVDPTLTAAADFRAIETVRGNVILGSTSGNVGIGTTAPASLLHVKKSDPSAVLAATVENTSSTNASAAMVLTQWSTPSSGSANSWTIRNIGNSAGELAFIPTAGNSAVSITQGGNVDIGLDAATFRVPRKAASGDPTGADGMIYYNDNAGTEKFRCYQNGAWTDCIGAAGSTTMQQAYGNDTDTGDTIIALTTADDSLIFRNPAASGTDSAYLTLFDQLNTGAKDAVMINQAGTGYALRVNDDGTSTDSSPFIIAADGNVGIGTTAAPSMFYMSGTTPDIKLEYPGQSTVSLFAGSSGGWLGTTSTSAMAFGTGTGTTLYLSDSSNNYNVGIGSTTPSASLDVTATGLAPAAGNSSRIFTAKGSIAEASSGNHPRLMGVEITAPTITGAAATVTDTASLYVSNSPSATVSGQNYSLWVDAGYSRFDGNVAIGSTNPDNIFTVVQGGSGIGTDGRSTIAAGTVGATFNTSGGAITNYVGSFTNSATRSAGANNLTNVGLYATASGAQLNYAAIFDQGNVGIGSTVPAEKLDVNGVVKLAQVSAPGTTTDKLYNVGGALTWNGTNISGGASKWTDAGTTTHLTSSDNVGIGTATASSKLHIYGASGFTSLYVQNDGTTGSDGSSMTLRRGGTSAYANMDFLTGSAVMIGAGLNSTDTTNGFSIWDGDAGGSPTRFYIHGTSGFVGIGSTSPASPLDVNGATFTPTASANARIASIGGAITEAGSGTHPRLMGVEITPPTITGAAATVTDTASLYIANAPTATVSGSNYALWVDGGESRFDGDIRGGGSFYLTGGSIYHNFDGAAGIRNNSTNGAAAMEIIGGANAASNLTLQSTSGAGSTDYINFEVGNNGATQAMRIISNGNVGIGTTIPSEIVDIQKAGTVKANTNLLELTNTGNAADMDGTASTILFNQAYSGGTVVDAAYISAVTETDWTSTASTQDSRLSFSTVLNGTANERLRIDSLGQVAIGDITDGPYSALQLVSTSATTMSIQNSGTNAPVNIVLGAYDSGAAYKAGNFGFVPNTGTNQSRFSFSDGSNERFVIRLDGNVGIGTTNPASVLQVVNATDPIISLKDSTNSVETYMISTDTFGALSTAGAHSLGLGTNAIVRMSIDGTTGNVDFSQDGATIRVPRKADPDPTGATGAMYYNSTNNKFRCYQGAAWTDCIAAGGSTTMQQAYGNDTDTGDTIIALTSADDSLIFRNPAAAGSDSTFLAHLEQLATGAVDNTIITHAGTGYALRVNDDGTTTDATPVVIDSTGNVGIGTTSALDYELNVISPVGSGSTAATIYSKDSGSGIFSTLNFGNNTSAYQSSIFLQSSTNTAYGPGNTLAFYQTGTNDINFLTNNLSRLYIDGDGNVGIGSLTPAAKLDVYGITTDTASNIYSGMTTLMESNPGGASTTTVNGIAATGQTANGNAQNFSTQIAVRAGEFKGRHKGTGTASDVYGVQSRVWNDNTGTITNAVALAASIRNDNASGTITNGVGLYVVAPVETGPITNKFAILTAQTAGTVGLGTTNPTAMTHVVQNSAADAFRVDDATSDTTPFVIDQNGSVGIGTASPQNILHVHNPASTASSQAFFLQPSLPVDNWTSIGVGSGIGNDLMANYGFLNKTTASDRAAAIWIYGDNPNSGQGLFIKRGGSVGIGTIAPGSALDIVGQSRIRLDGASTTNNALVFNNGTASVNYGSIGADSSTNLVIRQLDSTKNIVFLGAANVVMPSATSDVGTTVGSMYYNSSSGKFRCYQGAAWTDCIAAGSSPTLNSIAAATGNSGAITHGNYTTDWQWNSNTTTNPLSLSSSSLTSGSLLNLTVTGAGGITGQKGLNISTSGAVTGAQTTYGAYISNTHTGGSTTNTGLYATASGSSAYNYAAIFDQGNVAIGTTFPTRTLDIVSNVTHSAGGTASQVSIRGTATNLQKLNIGYDTTSNYGFIESVAEGSAWQNLALQPSGGNVGIGTTSPSYAFHFHNGGAGREAFFDGNVYLGGGGGDFVDIATNSSTASAITIKNGATAIMTIPTGTSTGAGNVGIGTTTPGAITEIQKGDTSGSSISEALRLSHINTTGATGGSNGMGTALTFYAEDATDGTVPEIARIASSYTDATNSSKDAQLLFYTLGPDATAGSNTPTVKMAIDSSGHVGINSTGPTARLEVVGDIVSKRYAASTTVSWANGNTQSLTLANNGNTLTFSNPVDGGKYTILLKQPASGAAGTVTWPTNVRWAAGTAPVLTTTNGRTDAIGFIYRSDTDRYLGVAVVKDFNET